MKNRNTVSLSYVALVFVLIVSIIYFSPLVEGDTIEEKFSSIKKGFNILVQRIWVKKEFEYGDYDEKIIYDEENKATKKNTSSKTKKNTSSKTSSNTSSSSQKVVINADVISDTVEKMKENKNITKGQKVYTYGYYNKNDGGSAYYLITDNTDSVDNVKNIKLSNGLVAELIIENQMSIKQFGVYGNGKVDDTKNVNIAISSMSGRTLYVPSGTYMVGERVNLVSNITIIGEGESSLFKALPGMPVSSTLFITRDKKNITIKNIAISGNSEYNTREQGHSPQDGIHIFDIWSSSDIRIEECVFKDNIYAAIRLIQGISNITVYKTKFKEVDCGVIALGSGDISNLKIQNSYFDGHYNSEPISLYGTGKYTDILIDNNIIKNKTYAVAMYLARGTIKNLTVTNNQIYDTAVGIEVGGATNAIIKNNTINNKNNLHNGGGSGIIVTGSSDIVIANNKVSNIEQDGMHIKNSTSVDIYNNTITNAGYKNKDFTFVRFQGSNNGVKFHNNTLTRADDSLNQYVMMAYNKQNTKIYDNTFVNGKIFLYTSAEGYVVKNNGTIVVGNSTKNTIER